VEVGDPDLVSTTREPRKNQKTLGKRIGRPCSAATARKLLLTEGTLCEGESTRRVPDRRRIPLEAPFKRMQAALVTGFTRSRAVRVVTILRSRVVDYHAVRGKWDQERMPVPLKHGKLLGKGGNSLLVPSRKTESEQGESGKRANRKRSGSKIISKERGWTAVSRRGGETEKIACLIANFLGGKHEKRGSVPVSRSVNGAPRGKKGEHCLSWRRGEGQKLVDEKARPKRKIRNVLLGQENGGGSFLGSGRGG